MKIGMRALCFCCLVLASVVICVSSAMGQSAAPAVRIVNPIDERQLVTLGGTVHPLANAENDRGAAPDSTPLERIHLMLKRSPSQQAALDQLVGQLHTPGHPNYHRWLTPDQFGQQFGPSNQDIAGIEKWLTGHGFSVAGSLPGKQVIEFSGNVGQFRSAFHAQIHRYQVNGESHFANATDPEIPAAIAPVVGGFVSLNNFHAKNQAKLLGKAQYDRTTDRAIGDWTLATEPVPSFVLAPPDFAVEYDLNPLYSASTPVNGSGQTIAIINDSNVNITLVNQFRSLFNLPANPPQVIIDGNDPGVDGVNNPDGPNGDSVEAYLDVEWAGAVAPNATIDLVIGADTELQNGLSLAAEHAVFGNLAPVMSISFGSCERTLQSSNGFWNNLWEQAAAQGTTVMVSTGDSGSAGCDNDDTQYYAVQGQNVNGIASTPFNVAVGGTDFYYSFWNSSNVSLLNFSPYWNTSPQHTPAASLLGYLSEQPWNDSQFGDDLTQSYAESGDMATSIAAGSGGASNAAFCSSGFTGISTAPCSGTLSGYPKPSWQVGTGVPADQVRDLPDVSLFASNGANFSFYALCAVDGDCQPATGSNVVQISGVGGTSASSPSFAGMMALVNQKYGPQGQANYVLYPLAKQFPAVFHDVTTGTNTVPCALILNGLLTAAVDCIPATSAQSYTVIDPIFGSATEGELGTGTTAEYNAVTGYDLASGLGSIDANQMVTDWASVKFDSTATTLSVTPSSFMHGTAPTISGTVVGTGTPAGDVALLTNSTQTVEQSQTFFTLSSGAYSNNTVNFLPGGTYDVWTQYGGDGTNGVSTSIPVQVTVTPENSMLELNVIDGTSRNPISSSPQFTYGFTPLILDAKPLPASAATCSTNCTGFQSPSGTVVFFDGGTPINTAVLNSEGDAEYSPQFTFNGGSHSITASYSGDNSYNASSASAIAFTIVKASPMMNVTGSAGRADIFAGETNTLSIAVEASLNGASPTGTVSIMNAPAGVPTSVTLVPGVDPVTGTRVGQATVSFLTTAVPGLYTLELTYTPDSASSLNYGSTSTSYSMPIIALSGVTTSTSAIALSSSTSPEALVTINGTVTASSGGAPSGSVYFLFPAVFNGIFEDIYQTSQVATLNPGVGSSSTYSMTFAGNLLPQGANQITAQYAGSATDDPSTAVVTIGNSLADFSLIANSAIVPVAVGSTSNLVVNLQSTNGFSAAVSLTCNATGVTCAIPSSATLASGGATSVTLEIGATDSLANGNYNVQITGKDPTMEFVHTLGIQAVVTGSQATSPSFVLGNSGNISLAAGSTTGNTSLVSVNPSNGFAGTVDLTCSVAPQAGAPNAVTCAVPSSVDVTGTKVVTATLTAASTSSTTAGTYTLTVTGTSAGITQTTTVNVTVNQPAPAIYALTNSANISVIPGATTGNTSAITVTPYNGFTGTVALTCAFTSNAATNPATCSLSPASVDITTSSALTSTLTINTTGATSAEKEVKKLFWQSTSGAAVAFLLFFLTPRRRSHWLGMLGLLVVFAGLAGMGCGGSGANGGNGAFNNGVGEGGGNTGTTSGSYTVKVTGTTGSASQMTAVTLTVN
jgi:trimeric autotransporter adhesin